MLPVILQCLVVLLVACVTTAFGVVVLETFFKFDKVFDRVFRVAVLASALCLFTLAAMLTLAILVT